jgi:hypothetical protein
MAWYSKHRSGSFWTAAKYHRIGSGQSRDREGLSLALDRDMVTEQKKPLKAIWIPQAIVIVWLVAAFNPGNPAEYYIALRWICCGCFGYLAYRAYEKGMIRWTWRHGIVAVVYNPFFSFHLRPEILAIIYVITIVIAIGSIVAFRPPQK